MEPQLKKFKKSDDGDDQEMQRVYQDFVKSFAPEDSSEKKGAKLRSMQMSFVKGSTLLLPSAESSTREATEANVVVVACAKSENVQKSNDAGTRQSSIRETQTNADVSRVHVQKPKLSMDAMFNSDDDDDEDDEVVTSSKSLTGAKGASAGGKPMEVQKKRNIDLFLEEIKEHEKAKREISGHVGIGGTSIGVGNDELSSLHSNVGSGMTSTSGDLYDDDDPASTNLYVGNMSPNVTEQVLEMEFGKYGAIASVKIMWPRKEEEKMRNRNSGFVNFMNKQDAANAKRALDGLLLDGYHLRVGWGKRMHLPSEPVYAPPSDRSVGRFGFPEIHVPVPKDQHLRRTIYRMAFFVANSSNSYHFEKSIMELERNSAKMEFLFDTRSMGHLFYKWKVYSLAQGDTLREWRTAPFQMFENGVMWFPPPCPIPHISEQDENELQMLEQQQFLYQQHITTTTTTDHIHGNVPVVTAMSDEDRNQLEDILLNLSLERESIQDAMTFCLDHAESSDEIVKAVSESLTTTSTATTPIPIKVARLYLVSDILHNTTTPLFMKSFEKHMSDIFTALNNAYKSPTVGRLTAEQMKDRVEKVLDVWIKNEIYPEELSNLWKALFLSDNSVAAL